MSCISALPVSINFEKHQTSCQLPSDVVFLRQDTFLVGLIATKLISIALCTYTRWVDYLSRCVVELARNNDPPQFVPWPWNKLSINQCTDEISYWTKVIDQSSSWKVHLLKFPTIRYSPLYGILNNCQQHLLLILIAQVEPYHLWTSQSTKLLMDNSKVGTVGRVGLPALAHDVVTGGGGREREGERLSVTLCSGAS